MTLWRRLFAGRGSTGGEANGDTESVRRIAARLEQLPAEEARFLAAFAYVLARLAHADLRIEDQESREMERLVAATAQIPPEEAALAVEIAKSQARLLGGTENYVVTREFRKLSTPEQRLRLVECLYAVAAADRWITNAETTEIAAIADELGLAASELAVVRARYRDRIAALRSG
jgi:uncharacterized tellurite resistance protein B-like protein